MMALTPEQQALQERRVILSEKREARFERAQEQRERRESSGGTGGGWTPGRAARAVTTRSGTYSGKGTLAGLLLAGFVIVAIRLVADAEVSDDGTTVKANVMHPQGELGPVPILAALIATFFVLSFVAIGGGLRAKLAVIMGGAIVLTLGVRSLDEIKQVGTTFGKIGKIVAPAPSGQLADIYGNAGPGGQAPASAGSASGQSLEKQIETNLAKLLFAPGYGLKAAESVLGGLADWLKGTINAAKHIP